MCTLISKGFLYSITDNI